MFYVLLVILAIAVTAFALTAVVNAGKVSLAENRSGVIECRKALNEAEKTLRSIANGSGNPVLEAQIALDEINNNYHAKEIN